MIKDICIVETLANMYGAFIPGKRVSTPINKIVAKLSEMLSTNGNIFKIPPYFAYTMKLFSVLKGLIGLGIKKESSIIAEYLPYTLK